MTAKKQPNVAEQRRLGLTKSHDELWAKHQFTEEETAWARAELERLKEEDEATECAERCGVPARAHAANGATLHPAAESTPR